MPVRYNGQYLIPAPLINVEQSTTRKEDGRPVGREYVFNLNGAIVNVDNDFDSPGASGLSNMEAVQREQNRIRDLFSIEPALFEIISPYDSNSVQSAYVTVDNINFQEGVWVNICRYNVTLRAKSMIGASGMNNLLDSESESWQVTENEDGTYGVNHQISARGRLIPSGVGAYNNALQNAKDWVRSRSYTTSTAGVLSEVVTGSGVMNLSTLINALPQSNNYWNKSTVENVDPTNFTYSLTENFVYNPSGNTLEQYSISIAPEFGDPKKYNFTINGNIVGFSDRISSHDARYTNAKTKYETVVAPAIYSRISALVPATITLNVIPVSNQVTYEVTGNSVAYSRSYVGSSGLRCIPGSVEESIDISDVGLTDVFATIAVPGRAGGPVFQNMETKNPATRSVNVTALMNPSGTGVDISSLLSQYLSKPDTNAIINALKPSLGYFYLTQDQENWNVHSRAYARSVSWTLQPASGSIAIPPGTPSGGGMFN